MSVPDFPAWKNYLDVVPGGGLEERLSGHLERVSGLLADVADASEDKADYAYVPGKWTVRQVVGHILVSQRIFVTRAVCIARGETQPLPGYDENAYARDWPALGVSLADLAGVYAAEAAVTAGWLRLLRPEELTREGVANGTRARPEELLRALIGHESHHLAVLRDRYGLEISA